MIKMIDVLEQNLVQNFIHSLSAQNEHFEELIDGIINAPAHDFEKAMLHFFNSNNPVDVAQALDINQVRLDEIRSGLAMQKENLADTAKIVALCLALETDSLAQVEIPDCLQDYPM